MTERHVRILAADGTSLFALDCGGGSGAPLLCLPGLTRNTRDFQTVIDQYADHRRVIACDFRGRGRSGRASDPATYRPDVELADTISILDHLGVERVALIGTSRGGIVGMLMAALDPGRIAGLFLNDIGPVIEAEGLLRILSYVGQPRVFHSWDDAVAALKTTNAGFANLSDAGWMAYARRVFSEQEGRPFADYDPRIAGTLPPAIAVKAGELPDMWPLIDNLKDMPVAVLRGANSDLLSAATVQRMAAVLPGLMADDVPDRGHVPFLDEPVSKTLLSRWLAAVDAKEKGRSPGP